MAVNCRNGTVCVTVLLLLVYTTIVIESKPRGSKHGAVRATLPTTTVDDDEIYDCGTIQFYLSQNKTEYCPTEEGWTMTSCVDGQFDCCRNPPRLGVAYRRLDTNTSLTSVPKLPLDIQTLSLSFLSLTSEELTDGFFANVPQLRSLVLYNNNITTLNRTVFAGMTQLTCLVLEYNQDITWEAVAEALAIPGLQDLDVSNCRLQPPRPDVFVGLDSSVYSLTLRSNLYPYTYDLTAFSALENLYELDLDDSELGDIYSSKPLLQLHYMQIVSNTMKSFPRTCTDQNETMFPNLIHMELQENWVSSVSNINRNVCLPELTFLDLGISFLKFTNFESQHFPRLESLSMDYNLAFDSMVDYRWTGNTFSNPSLRNLYLSRNYFRFSDTDMVDGNVFRGCPHRTDLNVGSNDFLDVTEDRFSEVFGHLRSLETLDISNSKVAFIFKTIAKFTNLTTLDLSSNFIFVVPEGAFHFNVKLQVLDLTYNQIFTISETTFSAVTRNSLTSIGLGMNPFQCTCHLLWFRDWFKKCQSVFVDDDEMHHREDYTCRNLANTPLYDFTMTQQACMLSREASVMIIVVTNFILLCFTLYVMLFRYRWHIRLLLYEAFRGPGDARRRRLQQNNFDYDVFLSYASEDLRWVKSRLMPQLEERLGLRVCIHQRDFIIGNNIVDNIAESVENSKKMIMVFSRHFVRSQWCQFELNYCLHHVMSYEDTLIVLCVDDVASREMTSAMMALLKTTTYIQWREIPDAVRAFWGRVGIALQEIMV